MVSECGSPEPGILESQGINYLQHLAIQGFPIAAFIRDCFASPVKLFSHLALCNRCKQLEFIQDKIN